MQDIEVQAAPLYQQIVTRVRHMIALGELQEGDRLPSLRKGSRLWGVNLHTVRRAYESLAEEGLVETAPKRGTVVAASDPLVAISLETSLDAFVTWVADSAAVRFGVGPDEVARRLSRLSIAAATPVWVLECSESLARDLARRVAEWGGLDARPWPLDRVEEVPAGQCLATYYHYARVRLALASRPTAPRFFRVEFDDDTLGQIRRAAGPGTVRLLAPDPLTGHAMRQDLEAALGPGFAVLFVRTTQPEETFQVDADCGAVVFSPECWDALPSSFQEDPRAFPLRFRPCEDALRRIAAELGWPNARGRGRTRSEGR